MAIVKFYGNLKQYGDKFKINAETAAEALNCLYLQIAGLKNDIKNGFFRVRINKHDITEKTVQVGLQSRLSDNSVIHIVPVAAGAKNGVLNVIAGVVMVVVGCWTEQPWLVGMGIGMMAGGVAMMMTKMPKMKDDTNDDGKKSTSFSSLGNTAAQGAPVPLPYGEIMVGSRVESEGVETMDVE
ncbi:tail assembly protein [Gilliamella sp. B3486]|uniref:hypothetical protein n=1 Tax=unclassified Gilliamella TaxID=2685620 RepID=UPI002269C68E|nr:MULTISPECIES: hypothetical protein [unclassified Gilliamella]MCX8596816.1 tail assembly protein [Gilliamella sp. B3493]MCX8598545.1 tail assembly protein [Gilliamella sp. B3486]MCX8704532.1 tail assembly protein [Gilliamella sp. B3127]